MAYGEQKFEQNKSPQTLVRNSGRFGEFIWNFPSQWWNLEIWTSPVTGGLVVAIQQDCVVVGLGESGADIVREISEVQVLQPPEGVEMILEEYAILMKLCLNVVKMYICPIYRSWCRFFLVRSL